MEQLVVVLLWSFKQTSMLLAWATVRGAGVTLTIAPAPRVGAATRVRQSAV